MNGLTFKKIFEREFPLDLAYSWDNVGLQIGTLNKDISRILLSLDLTLEVVNEAIKKDAQLIVVHHPLLFSAIKVIDTDSYKGKIIELLIKNNITVYVAHTNYDISNVGMNKTLADLLRLKNQRIIEFTTDTEGLGRIGELDTEIDLQDFIEVVKTVFDLDTAKLIGDLDNKVKTVAISGGSGSSIITHPNMQKSDIYITGDITYHHALDCLAMGLTVLDVGHNIEKFSLIKLKELLENNNDMCEIILSNINTNPYKNV